MSATAQARAWVKKAEAVRTAAASPRLLRVWLYARLLPLSHLSPFGRVAAFVYYRVLRQPPALRDEDGCLKFYDIRTVYGSRPAAHRQCGDGDDAIIGLVYGRDYGTPVGEDDTFCRPLLEKYKPKDEADALLYTDDLEEQIVSEAAERSGRIIGAARDVRRAMDSV